MASVFNWTLLLGNSNNEEGENGKPLKGSGVFNPLGSLSRLIGGKTNMQNNKRSAYFFLGMIIIILGFVAIFFTGFLDEPITFE
ncbi:MAG TPA: hypothetical protein VD905_04675 [Flavobacteriales bacterium]|nr:hypothetical protein [Flavobacteriales bacterium]